MTLIILISINCIVFEILGFNNVFILSLLLACNEILIGIIIKEIKETIILKKKYQKINYACLDKFVYFRELLKEYSISELGIIYNNKIDINTLISLEIVNLINKGKIKIDNNSVIILNRENLNFIQTYLLDAFKFIDLPSFKNEFKKNLKSDLSRKQIFKTLNNEVNFIAIFVCVILFLFVFAETLSMGGFFVVLGSLSFVLFLLELWVLMVVFSQYSINMKTKKGQEIYLKLVGLKKYLKDFNNFDEKQLKEISLWEEYILYAVILNEGKKIKKDNLKLFIQISQKAKDGSIKVIDYTKKNLKEVK